MKFAKRMDQFGEGVFSRLAEMRKQRVAQGKNVIDLSIGAPNIPPDKRIMEAMAKAVMDPGNYVYAISDTKAMLDAVAAWYKRRYKVELQADKEICSLIGSQDGLAHIALSILDPGDLMLVPDPCYPIFADGPKLAGAELYYMPQKKEHNYVIQLKDIPEDVARRAKLMLVSYPNNPTAAMAPREFYEELIEFAKKYDIIVIHDNAYSELVFDGATWGSFLELPGAKEVGVEFNSLSKTYSITGWRLGYVCGPERVIEGVKKVHDFLTVGAPAPLQEAAAVGLDFPDTYYTELLDIYTRKRNFFLEGLDRIGLKHNIPQGTYFVMLDIREFLDLQQFSKFTDLEFCEWMIKNIGVAAVPGSSFFREPVNHLIRLHFARQQNTLEEALRRLRKMADLLPNDNM